MFRNWIPFDKLDIYSIVLPNKSPKVWQALEHEYNSRTRSKKRHFCRDVLGALFQSIEAGRQINEPRNRINWRIMSSKRNAIPLLEQNIDKVDWKVLSGNPNAISILEQNLDKVDWEYLSGNPNAISILEQNLDKVDWDVLCARKSHKIMQLLEQNLDKVNWSILSRNTNAMYLLQKNLDKVDWESFSSNSNIFEEDDYDCK